MPHEQILIPEYATPDFCPKCRSPIINKRKARLVNPRRREREAFRCAQSKFLKLGKCEWDEPNGWISPKPVSVGIVLWYSLRDRSWYVIVEKRGIPPGKDREAFVAGFVEPGHTCTETCITELRQEVQVGSRPSDWHYVGQTSPTTNPMLLLTFYAKAVKNRRMPKLRPDGHETIGARWVRVDQLTSHADLAWPQQIAMVHRALHLVDPEHFPLLSS